MKVALVSLIAISLLSAISVQAEEEMGCQALLPKDCDCPASLQVKCSGYASNGFIANDQRVLGVHLLIRKKNGEKQAIFISEPKAAVRAYYSPLANDQAKRELARAGVDLSSVEQVRFEKFLVPASTTIYKFPGIKGLALEQMAVLGKNDQPTLPTKNDCEWITGPYVVNSKSCGPGSAGNICMGRVVCSGMNLSVACMATGRNGAHDSCPSADACVADEQIKISKPKESFSASSVKDDEPASDSKSTNAM